MESTKATRNIGGTDVTFETGKLAKQAGGAATVTIGETQVLATSTSGTPREGIDFFPLTVDVEERMYAAGKIPGGFFRREGRPSETAILTARLTDRPMRPSFADGFRDEVHIVVTVLSVDMAQPYDIPSINGASLATLLAGLPFEGPVGAVRVGNIGGQWKVNPTYQELDLATFDMVVAGRRNDEGTVDILMIEGEATDEAWRLVTEDGATSPTEDVVAEGLEAAKAAIGELIDFQREFVASVGVERKPWEPRPVYSQEVYDAVAGFAWDRMAPALVTDRSERDANLDALKAEVKEHLLQAWGEDDFAARQSQISPAFKEVQKKVMRKRVIEDGVRLDGRRSDEIRQLSAEVGVLPRAHGSGLFQRGDTQVLNVTTLGMLRMTQMIDTLDPEESKRYIHHYNFPPFSTGEVGFMRGPKRREIGHGALAERALVPVIPDDDEFPYALRLVSDVLSSNGSTSMASVCASTLSLMDAGVPIKAPVAGIAMGMIAEGDNYVTLTDILGAEDALGDMDFKVAGTSDWVTAIQLDMKVTGLPAEALNAALKQAKEARLQILDVMLATIPEPRQEPNPNAPRVEMIQIPVDKIGEVIGPKGKRINEIIALTGADIDIQDDGRVFVGSREGSGASEAIKMIDQIVNPKMPEIGERYDGTVVKTTDFGAFVNIMPGTDGLVHISKLGRGKRLNNVEDAVKQGDHLTVEVENVEADRGRIALKPVGEGWDPPEGGWPKPEGGERDTGDYRPRDRSGGRDRDRGPRRSGGSRDRDRSSSRERRD
ncbi:MAG TPA: polyribonucleotide nucleotidyltransferase [Actinomycetota bacterium]|nr:polyribonucleotide nucleotidyltransferase [Actinomycetota bacterium]